jgi:hypothetical protein
MMREAPLPYSLPTRIEADLERVRVYWAGLNRASAQMPFWDDLKLADLADRGDSAMLIDAFQHPRRFRMGFLGRAVTQRYGASIAGKFFDEIALRDPLDQLDDQCAATLERRAPTYFRHLPTGDAKSYARVILPMWGNGHIEMLLGAVAAT